MHRHNQRGPSETLRASESTGRRLIDAYRRASAARRRHSAWIGAAYFGLAASAYLATIAVATTATGWLARIAFAALHGAALTMLFVVGRAAAHGRLTSNARVNGWLARLALMPCLHGTRAWSYSDTVLHGMWANVRGMDPICCPLTFEEFHALTPVQQRLQRLYRSWFGLLPLYVLTIWWPLAIDSRQKHGASRRRARAVDRSSIAAFMALEFAALLALRFHLAGPAEKPLVETIIPVALALCLSFTTFAWLMGAIVVQRYIHPAIVWYSAPSERSLHRSEGALGAELIRRAPFTFARMSRALGECQLYDYGTHQWLTFDGRPTTAPRIVRAPSYESRQENDAVTRKPNPM